MLKFMVGRYAQQIYLSGSRRFTARDDCNGIPAVYHDPVKAYASTNYYLYEIDNALAEGWNSQQEYDDTVARGCRANPAL